MPDSKGGSRNSLMEATRSRADFSGHGSSKGAAGFISPYDEDQAASFLSRPGETAIVNPPKDGMKNFEIGAAWDNLAVQEQKGFFKKLMGQKVVKTGIDLDVGCLYELKNSKRGSIQAFGNQYGAFETEPFIHLSGDEQTGDTEGEDEVIRVNGTQWHDIERILIYVYIYKGAENWDAVKPQIQVRVPGEDPMVVTLKARKTTMALCAVAGLENIRGGIRMTNHLEYYPGHAEMDRAFGFGLEWEQGKK